MTVVETGRLPADAPALGESTEPGNLESSRTAIAWGPVIAGAVAALSTTFILVSLGSALGLAVASPWSDQGASIAAIGVGTAIWLVVVQWLSSAFGGYLAGRLRTKWAALGSDEVFFRDTAHGFLAWSLATVFVVGLLASAVGGTARVTAAMAAPAAGVASGTATDSSRAAGYVDSLFRPATPNSPAAAASDVRDESARIIARAASPGGAAPADRTYLAQLVALRTGLSEADAETHIDQVVATAKQDAETARKAASSFAFLTSLSLLIGAFVAAAGGALGGRHRDEI